MNRTTALTAALLLAAATGATFAQGTMGAGELGWVAATPATTATKTRAEVRAELEQARRDGTAVAAGDIGATPYEARATTVAGLGRTRAEVKAELAAAKINGDVIVGDSSVSLREEFPQRYPKQRVAAQPTLAQGSTAAAVAAR